MQLGWIYVSQYQQSLKRLLCSLVREYTGAAGNDISANNYVLSESQVFVRPPQPPLSYVGVIRQRQGPSPRALQRG